MSPPEPTPQVSHEVLAERIANLSDVVRKQGEDMVSELRNAREQAGKQAEAHIEALKASESMAGQTISALHRAESVMDRAEERDRRWLQLREREAELKAQQLEHEKLLLQEGREKKAFWRGGLRGAGSWLADNGLKLLPWLIAAATGGKVAWDSIPPAQGGG